MGSAGKEGCPRTESYHESCDGSVCLLRSRHSSDTSSSLLGGEGVANSNPLKTLKSHLCLTQVTQGEAQKMPFPLFSVLRGSHTQ